MAARILETGQRMAWQDNPEMTRAAIWPHVAKLDFRARRVTPGEPASRSFPSTSRRRAALAKVLFTAATQPDTQHLPHLFAFRLTQRFVEHQRLWLNQSCTAPVSRKSLAGVRSDMG